MEMRSPISPNVFTFSFCRTLRSAALLLLLTAIPLRSAVVVPDRPGNFLLDQGVVFSPEARQRLEAALTATARDHDLHVYVMTTPTLRSTPTRTGGKASEFLNAIRAEWLKGKVGAVIIFDDEAGLVEMGASEEARKILPPAELSEIFRDPRLQSKRRRLGAAKLEETVVVLVRRLTELRVKIQDEAKSQATMKSAGVIAGIVMVAGAGFFAWKWRAKRARRKGRRSVHTLG